MFNPLYVKPFTIFRVVDRQVPAVSSKRTRKTAISSDEATDEVCLDSRQ